MTKTKRTKHTPGPWKQGYAPGMGGMPAIIADANNTVLAEMFSDNPANAKLIAAAPEMLEALKNILHMLEGCHGDHSGGIGASKEEAFEAIAQAEGEDGGSGS